MSHWMLQNMPTDSESPDTTAHTHRLIWAFTTCIWDKDPFSHDTACKSMKWSNRSGLDIHICVVYYLTALNPNAGKKNEEHLFETANIPTEYTSTALDSQITTAAEARQEAFRDSTPRSTTSAAMNYITRLLQTSGMRSSLSEANACKNANKTVDGKANPAKNIPESIPKNLFRPMWSVYTLTCIIRPEMKP